MLGSGMNQGHREAGVLEDSHGSASVHDVTVFPHTHRRLAEDCVRFPQGLQPLFGTQGHVVQRTLSDRSRETVGGLGRASVASVGMRSVPALRLCLLFSLGSLPCEHLQRHVSAMAAAEHSAALDADVEQ